ncbi:MAG: hypothetical protein MUF49_03975 [Oculatellaceae cyanobacterium Prado106]|jgi:hypothetical protein|nr:hypothetical protein [Oculatellaceae cyanobacterium Prado106]
MVEFYDLIHNIEKRPALYLGQPTITHLGTFLAGYNFARRQLGIPQTEQEQRFSEFQEWIEQKFKVRSSQSWEKIILFYSQDEFSALKFFFTLFHEFSQEAVKETVQATVESLEGRSRLSIPSP